LEREEAKEKAKDKAREKAAGGEGVGEGGGAGRARGMGQGGGAGEAMEGERRKGENLWDVPTNPGARAANLRLPCWSGLARFPELFPVLSDYFLRGRQGTHQHFSENCPLGAGQGLDQLSHFRLIALTDLLDFDAFLRAATTRPTALLGGSSMKDSFFCHRSG
jgi:hypothetical protein